MREQVRLDAMGVFQLRQPGRIAAFVYQFVQVPDVAP
jgi:hypothetical protein